MGFRGDRVKTLRDQQGFTQEELAERVGINTRNITRYENNENEPSVEIVIRIARELETTADYLLGMSDSPQTSIQESDLSPDEAKLLAAFRGGNIKKALHLLASTPDVDDQSVVPPRKKASNS